MSIGMASVKAEWVWLVAVPFLVGAAAFVADFPPRLPRIVTLVFLAFAVPCLVAALVLLFIFATKFDQL